MVRWRTARKSQRRARQHSPGEASECAWQTKIAPSSRFSTIHESPARRILADMQKTMERVPSPKLPPRWQAALSMKVRPDEIVDLVQEMSNRHEAGEEAGFFAACGFLMNRYRSKGKKKKFDHEMADRVYCITTRMECLASIMSGDDPRLRGYTKDANDPACTLTYHSMFHAAALCTIRCDEKRTWFDPDEFFDIALREAEPEGTA